MINNKNKKNSSAYYYYYYYWKASRKPRVHVLEASKRFRTRLLSEKDESGNSGALPRGVCE